MKHNSPQGPQPTGVAIYGQFPVLWAWLSGEQILGLDLPGEWVLGLDLSLGGPLPLPLSSSSPIAVNISTKWKRKKKTKKKKISSLEATGSLRPGQPWLSPEQSGAAGPGSQDFSVYVCIPSRGGQAARAAFYNPETEKNLDATAKQRTRFFPGTCFCRLLPCSACPWHQSALLGRVPHCLPQDWGLSSPLPTGPGEAPLTPKDAFVKMAVLSL